MQPAYGPALETTQRHVSYASLRVLHTDAGGGQPVLSGWPCHAQRVAVTARSATIFGVMKTSSSVFVLSVPLVLNR